MSDPPATLRKVQLDSIDDLRFIYENLVKSAREKIELHLPPAVGGAGAVTVMVDGGAGEGKGHGRKSSRRTTRSSTGAAAAAAAAGGGGGKEEAGGRSAGGPGGGGEEDDPLRNRVEELVMEYITRTFDFASPNISINGLDAPSTSFPSSTSKPDPAKPLSILDLLKAETDEFEPYDRTLHTRLQSLYNDIETSTLKVSQQRRTVPDRALRRYEKALNHEVERDLKMLEQIAKEGEEERRSRGLPEMPVAGPSIKTDPDAMQGVEATGDKEAGGVKGGGNRGEKEGSGEGSKGDERHKEMVRDWERSMAVMGELAKGLPATAHKLERAKAAVEYIQGKERKRKRGTE